MQQDIETLRPTSGALSGRLSIGVIPSALPMVGVIGQALRTHHPDVDLTVLSQSSIEILRNLEDFSIRWSGPSTSSRLWGRSRMSGPFL